MRRLIIGLILMIVGVTLTIFMYFGTPQACATSFCVGRCWSSSACYGDCVCIKIGGEVMGNCASIN